MVPAYNGSEPYIFVSYAHKDSAEVYGTIEKLTSLGYRIWYDEGIKPGVEWPENIAVHLDQCALFLMFISPNSMASANCRREINFALSRSKKFLCVVLKKTEIPLGMELQLASQQSIFRYKYTSEEAYIYKICSAAGMSQCKDTHFYDGEKPTASAIDPIPYGIEAGSIAGGLNTTAAGADTGRQGGVPAVTPSPKAGRQRKSDSASQSRNRKKNIRTTGSRKRGSGASGSGAGTVFFGMLVAAAIIIAFVFYLMNRGGFGNTEVAPNMTPTPTPTVTMTPTPTEAVSPTPISTQTEGAVTEPAGQYNNNSDNNGSNNISNNTEPSGTEEVIETEENKDENEEARGDDGNEETVIVEVTDDEMAAGT